MQAGEPGLAAHSRRLAHLCVLLATRSGGDANQLLIVAGPKKKVGKGEAVEDKEEPQLSKSQLRKLKQIQMKKERRENISKVHAVAAAPCPHAWTHVQKHTAQPAVPGCQQAPGQTGEGPACCGSAHDAWPMFDRATPAHRMRTSAC